MPEFHGCKFAVFTETIFRDGGAISEAPRRRAAGVTVDAFNASLDGPLGHTGAACLRSYSRMGCLEIWQAEGEGRLR